MECPYCEEELMYWDTFGRLFSHQDGHIDGYIYQCTNEDCENHHEPMYTLVSENESELHEGMPC